MRREAQTDLGKDREPLYVGFGVVTDVVGEIWGGREVKGGFGDERSHGRYTVVHHGMKFADGGTGERGRIYGLPLTIQLAD